MDLPARVMAELGVDERRAILGLGAVFTSIRMAVDVKSFSRIARALPDLGSWISQAPLQELETGELVALATPKSLERNLTAAGFTDEQIDALGALTGTALREVVGDDIVDQAVKKLPILG